MAEIGRDVLFEVSYQSPFRYGRLSILVQRIVSGAYRQILVSPEIATSSIFRSSVLSKSEFNTRLRALCIDEAHCISLWGGSFRPEYTEIGALRAKLPKHVAIGLASATIPDHILDDIRAKVSLSKTPCTVSMSNERPNIALSCRKMRHSAESKGDLRFLIPRNASSADDIETTLIYCNERSTTEDVCDTLRDFAEDSGLPRDCIAFYHAKVGTKRKRELEELLQEGKVRILVCTDAVGMVCTHIPLTQF